MRVGLAAALAAALLLPSTAMAVVAPLKFDVKPGSDVLLSEFANGGAGSTPTSSRDSVQNFVEITNYGHAPVDISGYHIYRCGEGGSGYPQGIVTEGTMLAPGEQYVAARAGSKYEADADMVYPTSPHTYASGAYLADASNQMIDAIGFYPERENTACKDAFGKWSQTTLQHRLDESHQRVANTGHVDQDWIVATRTVGADNATATSVKKIDNGLRITEFANGAPRSSNDQFVEFTNLGTEPVNLGGYRLFRCGDNGTLYLQNASLAAKTVAPGETYLVAKSGSVYNGIADATYTTNVAWRDFGFQLVTANDEIVDGVGAFKSRLNNCATGSSIEAKVDGFQAEHHVRVSDTGDNATDFAIATKPTPGVYEAKPATGATPHSTVTGIKFSEATAAGPAGEHDQFVEIGNYGSEPRNLKGWGLYRCVDSATPDRVAMLTDLGDVTLKPGEVHTLTSSAAPAELLDVADGTYTRTLAAAGWGVYLKDADGRRVDGIASYDINMFNDNPCAEGLEFQNNLKFDKGESATRVRDVNDNDRDYDPAPRTPGVLDDAPLVDPTKPLPGELDPVAVDTDRVPGTPDVDVDRNDPTRASVVVGDEDGTTITSKAYTAPARDVTVNVFAGSSPVAAPTTLKIPGETKIAANQALNTAGKDSGFPFQRFEISRAARPDAEFIWSGKAADRNEIQLLAWNGTAWEKVAAATPSADGDVQLRAPIPKTSFVRSMANLLVIDGPRTSSGLLDEVGVSNNAFADPGDYDFALNHMPDTQFLAEGFRDVFRRQASWIVANADARKIAYSSHTGDLIENWMNGHHVDERANREYQAAQDIMTLLNDANVPNGVMPGNHDNMWGRNNDKYNEYFPVEMYSKKEWYGESWQPGDNSAHTDFFKAGELDFMVISLQYSPSQEQLDWAAAQAAAHPNHNVIIAAHSYLHTTNVRDSYELRSTGNADEIWERVIAPNDNVFMAFGGHYHGVATNYADPVTGDQVDATTTSNGTAVVHNGVGGSRRTVVEMLADYQGYRSTLLEDDATATRSDYLDRDAGFQRLLQFDLDAGLMGINTYSPNLDSFEAWKYDEPDFRGEKARYDASDEEFVVNVSLKRNTTLSSTSWAVTGPAVEVSSATDVVGRPMAVDLGTDKRKRVWFVTATDADGNTVGTPAMALDGTQSMGSGRPGRPGTSVSTPTPKATTRSTN